MSLALAPVYAIARFMLPRGPALVVVVLAAVAPLMYVTTLGMSENVGVSALSRRGLAAAADVGVAVASERRPAARRDRARVLGREFS